MFDRLVHVDWSVSAGKRWAASADRGQSGWVVGAPALVGPADAFLERVFAAMPTQRVLAAFDFPIGVPAAYGVQTGFSGFRDLLSALGEGRWSEFCAVARVPEEISVTRPFYPLSSHKGVLRSELVAGLGVGSFDDLFRVCERRTAHRRAASCLFWTVGASQVGKGALTGWRDVIRPALLKGAALWPFDGTLADLAASHRVVLAEAYPADAYRRVGAGFLPRESKRRQADRRGKAQRIQVWADRHDVVFTAATTVALAAGFGSAASGEDQFDALLGLLTMIEIADGRREEQTERHGAMEGWEGWILGR